MFQYVSLASKYHITVLLLKVIILCLYDTVKKFIDTSGAYLTLLIVDYYLKAIELRGVYFLSNLGKKIKFYRKRLQMSQLKLAKKIGVARSTLASWEINRRDPDLNSLLKLSKLLQVSLDELFDLTPPPHKPKPVSLEWIIKNQPLLYKEKLLSKKEREDILFLLSSLWDVLKKMQKHSN